MQIDLIQEARSEAVRGDRKRAVKMLEQASRLSPRSPRPHQILCGILPEIGRQREALKHCQMWSAKESNPSYRVHAKARIDKLRRDLGL